MISNFQLANLLTFCILLLTFASILFAGELKFSRHFTDDMVLQREKPNLIRGIADKGEAVTVTFAGQPKEARAGDSAKWSVILDPMPASSEEGVASPYGSYWSFPDAISLLPTFR